MEVTSVEKCFSILALMAKALIREVIKGQLQSHFKGITLKKHRSFKDMMKYLECCAVLNTHTHLTTQDLGAVSAHL